MKIEEELWKWIPLVYPSVDAYIIYFDITICVVKYEECFPCVYTILNKLNDLGWNYIDLWNFNDSIMANIIKIFFVIYPSSA